MTLRTNHCSADRPEKRWPVSPNYRPQNEWVGVPPIMNPTAPSLGPRCASALRPFQMTQQGNSLVSTGNESLLILNRPATLHQKPYFPLVSVAQLCSPAQKCERKERATETNKDSKWVMLLSLRASLLSCIQKNITVDLRFCFCGAALSAVNISHAETAWEHPEGVQD